MSVYVQVPIHMMPYVCSSGDSTSEHNGNMVDTLVSYFKPVTDLLHAPQKSVHAAELNAKTDDIVTYFNNLIHAQENAINAHNYKAVVGYSREFAELLNANIILLMRLRDITKTIRASQASMHTKLDLIQNNTQSIFSSSRTKKK